MKSQTLTCTVVSPRCSYRTAEGRQCRQLSADPRSGLCNHHHAVQKQKEANDVSRVLLSESQGFQTAQGVNFALTNLYELLAANRISARRAAVLAYINSLLLRTLPAIDADQDAGVTDPTATEAPEIEVPSSTTPSSTTIAQEPDTTTPSITTASPITTFTEATPGWDASIPEPDPTKKPS